MCKKCIVYPGNQCPCFCKEQSLRTVYKDLVCAMCKHEIGYKIEQAPPSPVQSQPPMQKPGRPKRELVTDLVA